MRSFLLSISIPDTWCVQKREAGVNATVLLSLIDRMKGDIYLVKDLHTASMIVLPSREGTEESARTALVNFEKELDVYENRRY